MNRIIGLSYRESLIYRTLSQHNYKTGFLVAFDNYKNSKLYFDLGGKMRMAFNYKLLKSK